MRRNSLWILLAVIGTALGGDRVYKPPTDGALATIRLTAPGYAGNNLLRSASLSMLVQRIDHVGTDCQPDTLGWISYHSAEKTYSITADKIASFGVTHQRSSLAGENRGRSVFAFVPETDHRYEIEIAVKDQALDVNVYDETTSRTPVHVEQHYLIICARRNAAQKNATQQ